MAVTEILGTDSLSSSRITINDNFLSLEDEIADLKGYLDPTAATLSGVTLSTTQLEVGGSAISNTAATLGVATTINANIDMGAAVIYSGVSGSASSPLTSNIATFAHSTYFVDPTSGVEIGATSIDGTQITLISTAAGDVTGAFAGYNGTISFTAANETLTLRSINSVWYVIAKCIGTASTSTSNTGGTGGTGNTGGTGGTGNTGGTGGGY